MRGFLTDIALACRVLWKRPGFTAVVIITLALGIGVNSAIFSLLNAVVLGPLRVKDPDNLVRLARLSKDGPRLSLSYPEFTYFQEQGAPFSTVAARSWVRMFISDPETGETGAIDASFVSGNFFSLFPSPVAPGRSFKETEDRPGAAPVAVLSHGTWQKRFGADPDILGRQVTLNGHNFTIIGVCAKEFRDLSLHIPEVFVPLAVQSIMKPNQLTSPDKGWLQVFGVLKPGVRREEAISALNVLATEFDREYLKKQGDNVTLSEVRRGGPGTEETILLMSSVGLVLLIACANVSNLVMARATSRRKEFAVRASLGANRLRLIRHCFSEGLVLAVVSGLVGVLAGYWMADSLLAATGMFPGLDVGPDLRVLAYALFLCLVAVLVFGSGPAIRGTRINANQVLKEEGGLSGSRTPLRRNLLITCQVGASLALLIVAGLLLKGFYASNSAERGFSGTGVVQIDLDIKETGYGEEKAWRLKQQLIGSLRALAGVDGVAFATSTPYGHSSRVEVISSQNLRVGRNSVSAGYFQTLGIRLLAGRDFAPEESLTDSQVAVVSESLARKLWPDESPIGRTVQTAAEQAPSRIVGIVHDIISDEPRPYLYRPMSQPEATTSSILVRSSHDPRSLMASIRKEITSLDSTLQGEVNLLERNIEQGLKGARADSLLWGSLAVLAILLAVAGIYGVVSHATSQRRREVGVRMALGANSGGVCRLIVLQSLRPVATGLVLGIGLAVAASRLLASRLHGLSTLDLSIYVGLAFFVGIVAVAAAYLPARRISRIDPVVALRYE